MPNGSADNPAAALQCCEISAALTVSLAGRREGVPEMRDRLAHPNVQNTVRYTVLALGRRDKKSAGSPDWQAVKR
jgi:hypothetical protein